ncbi:transcription-repair coupling factor [Wukongibacter baidiensis]|uniref:transcription-repair coupling factor n=1 Tax=Wukongibacter baidiensis TaxID=1723361 RepID=UPI003D7FAA37
MNNLFSNVFKSSKEYSKLSQSIKTGMFPISITGPSGSAVSNTIFSLSANKGEQSLVIAHNELEARKIYEDLRFFTGDRVLYFPAKEITFYDVYAHSNQIIEERLKAIRSVLSGEKCIVVTTIDSILLRLIPGKDWISHEIYLKIGDIIDLSNFIDKLVFMGYERVDMVQGKGQFSVRGGIIDFYSFVDDYPIRIELFDDEVDSIRSFDIETQLSLEKLKDIIVKSTRETLIDDKLLQKGIDKIESELSEYEKRLEDGPKESLKEKIGEAVSKLNNRIYFDGIHNYINYLLNETETFLDYLHDDSLIFIHEPERIREKVQSYLDDFNERFKQFLERGEVLTGQYNILRPYEETLKDLNNRNTILINSLPKKIKDFYPSAHISFVSKDMHSYHGKMDLLAEDIKNWKYKGYKVVLLCRTDEKGKGIENELRDKDIECQYFSDFKENILSGQTFIIRGTLGNGFIFTDSKFIIISEKEIFGSSKKQRRKQFSKKGRKIKTFRDLDIGDYVVHENHGIGKYIGIEQLKVEDTKKDYLKIKYSGTDLLYVPIDQMDLVQKYIGGEEKAPKINKLGGAEWKRTKAKVKKAIEDMAQDLLKLYAARKSSKGYGFSKDSQWQRQFEDMFPYEETPDQLRCIEEVKVDMEKESPMDRLLCGDVGFGKTEVAIRAAFKAIMDGKQVAFLVPTTILAQQHYNTLVERFKNFPVTIEMLSRFRSRAQQQKILEDVRTGVIDIIVGTHRLLSKDLAFKDLGVLLVDEEQRFGVKHKEALKELKRSVDVLTLSATPIPRTLHMSLIGVRDMSIIEDPPEDRFPVETFVMPYNEGMVRDAIVKELERGGQVYFVYNRVKDIEKITSTIQTLVPEARVAYAHGQMSERKLEKIMISFLNKEFDVIVCTTIIETGLDIGNVNTMIIFDSDKLGLSQLYQLRGRVGRSSRIAYCYLTYEKDKVLSEVAEKRLRAIKEFTELGSGFKIAMKDLEIRGAGNLLGSQQHGHMSAIGYDLYCKLLEDTVKSLKGEDVEDVIETTIDINVDAFISSKYIANERYKLEIYKKIASIREKQDSYNIEEEIEDRFGTLPRPVYNLISISYIKVLAQKLKIGGISEVKQGFKFEFDTKYKLDPYLLAKISENFGRKIIINCSNKPHFIYRMDDKKGNQNRQLDELEKMLEKIRGFQHD